MQETETWRPSLRAWFLAERSHRKVRRWVAHHHLLSLPLPVKVLDLFSSPVSTDNPVSLLCTHVAQEQELSLKKKKEIQRAAVTSRNEETLPTTQKHALFLFLQKGLCTCISPATPLLVLFRALSAVNGSNIGTSFTTQPRLPLANPLGAVANHWLTLELPFQNGYLLQRASTPIGPPGYADLHGGAPNWIAGTIRVMDSPPVLTMPVLEAYLGRLELQAQLPTRC